jgi:hypothetical protein
MHFFRQAHLLNRSSRIRRFIVLLVITALFLVLLQLVFSFFDQSDSSSDLRPLAEIPAQAEQVETGIFAMNLYDIDAARNTYYLDFYLWFKWQGDIDPTGSLELANGVEDWGVSSVPVYEEPEELPDGSFYQAWRVEGRFVQPLILERYPLDRHNLNTLVENSVYTTDQLVYVADAKESGFSDTLAVPDWEIQGFEVASLVRQYTTNFGDPRIGDEAQHSVFQYSLKIARPVSFFLWKLLLPLIIVVATSWGSLLLNPQHIDSRIGLPVTGLLTAVFLQESYSSNLPDVGYLVLLDRIYAVAYILIFISILEAIVTAEWINDERPDGYQQAIQLDRLLLKAQTAVLLVGIVLIILFS